MSTLHTTPSGDIIKKYLCSEIKGICTEVRKICFRLLKGAPPGQEAVNHYISELSIVKGGNHKLDTKYRKHLAMIEVNQPSKHLLRVQTFKFPSHRFIFLISFISLFQACEDEYNYHHKLFGQGAVDR